MVNKFILCLLIILVNGCSSSSSSFLEKLRRYKAIIFLTELSSSNEFSIDEGSKFHLKCAFLSNFDKLDIFWFHNGTLIQSFLSKSILEEEDDDVEDSYLASTIISTIEIEKAHFDMNGLYQCIAIHDQITSQHSFNIHVTANGADSTQTNFSKDALITVHTYQSLFEPRSQTSLMCRVGNNQKNECTVQWFNPEDDLLDTLGEKTDLVLKNANFEDHMGLYKCEICCHNQCQTLTSFVYPAGTD